MKFRFREPSDKRLTAKRGFVREYLVTLATVLVCSTGALLMFNTMQDMGYDSWLMVVCIGSYTLFMCLVVSAISSFVMNRLYSKPLREIGSAARKVADGDFTVRIASKRSDGRKDELELLIDDFNKMTEELSSIETLKCDFIANVSHEMKTPLAIIKSYADALIDPALTNEKRRQYIDTISEAIHYLEIVCASAAASGDFMCLINKEKIDVDVFPFNHHMVQAFRRHHKNEMMILL